MQLNDSHACTANIYIKFGEMLFTLIQIRFWENSINYSNSHTHFIVLPLTYSLAYTLKFPVSKTTRLNAAHSMANRKSVKNSESTKYQITNFLKKTKHLCHALLLCCAIISFFNTPEIKKTTNNTNNK